MSILIFESCDDSSSNKTQDCEEWEYFDTDRDKCRLNENACAENIDCINYGDICKDNKCLTPVSCNEWENYNEQTNTCSLTYGRCLEDTDCQTKQYCNPSKICLDYPTVSWSTNCPSYLSPNAECATVKLPLNYNSGENKTVDTFIFRHLSTSNNVKGQIWFLQGGPGGSGSVFSKYYFDQYTEKYPDYDFYSLDHRGVANSSRLTCAKEATMNDPVAFRLCTEELASNLGDDLQQYSTTNAAKDVGFLLDILKEDNKQRFIYGVSYGTYWAERYLTIFPEQADGVILDSICTLKECYMDDYSYWSDVVGKQFMDVCAEDASCKAKMNTINTAGTKEAMMDVLNKMDITPCDFGYGAFRKADIQTFLTTMLMNFYARILIPPVLYRLNRCEDGDKAALKNLISSMYGMGGKKSDALFVTEAEMNSNNVLYYNIVFSELWYGRTQEEITEVFDNSLFNTGNGLDMYNMKNSSHWNEYGDTGYLNQSPNTSTPILMMNGTLDPQTALEIALPSKELFNKENQYFITFPQTPHGVSSSSITNEMISNFGQGTTCGEKIMFQFFSNPTQEPSTTCLSDMYQLSWADSGMVRGMGYQLLGTPDVWDGTPTGKKSSISSKFSKAINTSIEKTNLEYEKYPELIKFIKKIMK
jgi:hypothetical protein